MPRATVYIDVDDMLIRTSGRKRIPRPDVIDKVKSLAALDTDLYLWSSGGAEYAKAVAEQLKIAHLFCAFLPKPNLVIDDMQIQDWRNLRQAHPNKLISTDMAEILDSLSS